MTKPAYRNPNEYTVYVEPMYPSSLQVYTSEDALPYLKCIANVILSPAPGGPEGVDEGILRFLTDVWSITEVIDLDSQVNPVLEKFVQDANLLYTIRPITLFEDGQIPFGGLINTSEQVLQAMKKAQGKLLITSKQSVFVPGVLYYTMLRRLRFSVESATNVLERKLSCLTPTKLKSVRDAIRHVR